jgi:hypothetical protein
MLRLIFAFLTIAFITLWSGIVGGTLWNWFLATRLHLPHLSILEASGVCLGLYGILPVPMSPIRDSWSSEEKNKKLLEYLLINPTLALLIGAILHYVCGV